MIQTSLVAAAAIGSYFGLVFVVQHRDPTTLKKTSYEDIKITATAVSTPNSQTPANNPSATLTPIKPALPPEVIGEFSLNLDATRNWLAQQTGFPKKIAKKITNELQPKTIQVVGTTWTSTIGNTTYSETPNIIKSGPSLVSLMLKPSHSDEPMLYYIQIVNGGFWLSRYLPPSGSNKTPLLIREFYSNKTQ